MNCTIKVSRVLFYYYTINKLRMLRIERWGFKRTEITWSSLALRHVLIRVKTCRHVLMIGKVRRPIRHVLMIRKVHKHGNTWGTYQWWVTCVGGTLENSNLTQVFYYIWNANSQIAMLTLCTFKIMVKVKKLGKFLSILRIVLLPETKY